MWPYFQHIAFAREFEDPAEENEGPCRYASKNTNILLAADIDHDFNLLIPFREQGGFDIRSKEWPTYPRHVMEHDRGDITKADIGMGRPGNASSHDQVFVGKNAHFRISLIEKSKRIPT